MASFKLFLKIFIGVPLTIVGLVGVLASLLNGMYLYAIGIVIFLYLFICLCIWDSERDKNACKKAITSRGFNIDYIADYLDNGIAIDLKGRKILIGNLKHGKIINFEDAKSIEWEDTPYHGKIKYNLYINTNNFDTPKLGAGFAGNKQIRDMAYAKLSAALQCN